MLMTASPRERSAGFTLIELMIAVTLLAILLSVGLPSFQQMMRNYEVRVAAESVANGLQRARAEAVAKNARVQFVLGGGTSWTVDYVTKPVLTDPPLDARASTDGSTNATLTAVAADLSTAATTLTFNQLGQVVANADTSPALARVNFAGSGASQNLRVIIGAGGNARVCDPSLPSSNVRACP
jgi:type IV fimbrial biogenesis protein FimT